MSISVETRVLSVAKNMIALVKRGRKIEEKIALAQVVLECWVAGLALLSDELICDQKDREKLKLGTIKVLQGMYDEQ